MESWSSAQISMSFQQMAPWLRENKTVSVTFGRNDWKHISNLIGPRGVNRFNNRFRNRSQPTDEDIDEANSEPK